MDAFRLPYTIEHGIRQCELSFRAQASVEFLSPSFPAVLDRAQVAGRLAAPIRAYLAAQPARARRGLVVVEDDTRPSRLVNVLESLLDYVAPAGWLSEEITFLVAVGAHGPSGAGALRWKLGDRIIDQCSVVQHRVTECQPAGIPFLGDQLKLNSLFLQADWVILVGSCLPHPFAGFGGGFKLVVPGIASLENIVASHKLVLLRGRPEMLARDVPPFRELLHELANRLRPMVSIVCLVNYAGEVVDLYVDDPVRSYQQAVTAAKSVYRLSPPTGLCDVLLLNCYPKDRDLIQCKNGLVFHSRRGSAWLKDGGVVVLVAPGVRRVGVHEVLGPGGRLYQRPGPIKSLGSHRLWFYAPELPRDEYTSVFAGEYPLFGSWPELVERLGGEFPNGYAVAIVPAAALHV